MFIDVNEQLLNELCRLSLMYLVSWSSLLCLSYNIMELQARGSLMLVGVLKAEIIII